MVDCACLDGHHGTDVEVHCPGQSEVEWHHTLVVQLDQGLCEDVPEHPDVEELSALPTKSHHSKAIDDELALDVVEQEEQLMVLAE